MSEDTERRAHEAQRILGDPFVIEAFETLERELSAAWAATAENDEAGRERVYRMLRSMRGFKRVFEAMIEAGQLEQHLLQQIRTGHLKI